MSAPQSIAIESLMERLKDARAQRDRAVAALREIAEKADRVAFGELWARDIVRAALAELDTPEDTPEDFYDPNIEQAREILDGMDDLAERGES